MAGLLGCLLCPPPTCVSSACAKVPWPPAVQSWRPERLEAVVCLAGPRQVHTGCVKGQGLLSPSAAPSPPRAPALPALSEAKLSAAGPVELTDPLNRSPESKRFQL